MIIGFGSEDRRKLTQIHHPNKFSSTSGYIFGHLRRIDSWLEFSTGHQPVEWNGLAAGAAKQPNGFRCNEETFRSEILHRTGEDGIS